MKATPHLCLYLILPLLAACHAAPEPTASDLARAESVRPHNAALAERYERSCKTCHSVKGSGAPLTAFVPAWQERLKKGKDQLLQHAMEGIGAMPAKGSCNDCSADDIRALIDFMAAQS